MRSWEWCCGACATFLLLPSSIAVAHGSSAPSKQLEHTTWWLEWTWNPLVSMNLTLLAALYLNGWFRLRARGTKNMGIGERELVCFCAATATLALALLSPIDRLSDVLQSAHMVQHTLIMTVAAPLFVLSAPFYVVTLGLPRNIRRRISPVYKILSRWARGPLRPVRVFSALGLYAFTLWLWHAPTMYEATLRHELLHDVVHASFFVSSTFLWWVVFHPLRTFRIDYGSGILYLFVTSLHSCTLGVLTALAPIPLYPTYVRTAPLFGLTPLEDQQIAGYIMWMPAGFSYLVGAAILLKLWIDHSIRESETGKSRWRAPS